jgi:hypothetical protein
MNVRGCPGGKKGQQEIRTAFMTKPYDGGRSDPLMALLSVLMFSVNAKTIRKSRKI